GLSCFAPFGAGSCMLPSTANRYNVATQSLGLSSFVPQSGPGVLARRTLSRIHFQPNRFWISVAACCPAERALHAAALRYGVPSLKGLGFHYCAYPALTRWAIFFRLARRDCGSSQLPQTANSV